MAANWRWFNVRVGVFIGPTLQGSGIFMERARSEAEANKKALIEAAEHWGINHYDPPHTVKALFITPVDTKEFWGAD